MTDESSYQIRHGYYYVPYKDDGPWAKRLATAGGVVGKIAAAVVGKFAQKKGPIAAGIATGLAIGIEASSRGAGHLAGFYIDNLSAVEQNFNTFMDGLNDSQTWMGQDSGEDL